MIADEKSLTMKKVILFVALTISSIACKKDTTPVASNYYLKAAINGTSQTFTINAKATEFFGDFTNYLTLSADDFVGAGNNNPTISLAFNHGFTPLTTGTYLQGVFYPAAYVYNISGTYKSYSAGFNNQANPPLKITITQIDSKTVTGTFEGQYFDTTPSISSVVITDGKFYLPFK